ncbi:MAG: hypothetical protein K2J02_03260 [Malacoplasma sp.]|nr:hypothetical protein [Malacoplasma sp.]MDE6894364.1 hypothetical protein [Malacoplasma sp.]MDE7088189.1 hypothetical protein [Malacoplasma sp.]
MAKYTKFEVLKLTQFWTLVVGIILFILDSILAIAGVSQIAVIIVFVFAVISTAVAAGIWLYLKVKKTNRKLTQ